MEKEMYTSEELKEVMARLNKKLDEQLNGEVVNDTFVRHIKKAAQNVVDNHKIAEDMVKVGIPKDASEYLLFMFAAMSAGPIPDDDFTFDFKNGLKKLAKEQGLGELE